MSTCKTSEAYKLINQCKEERVNCYHFSFNYLSFEILHILTVFEVALTEWYTTYPLALATANRVWFGW